MEWIQIRCGCGKHGKARLILAFEESEGDAKLNAACDAFRKIPCIPDIQPYEIREPRRDNF